VTRPKGAAVKVIIIDVDIAEILGSEISMHIDIGNGDIDQALLSSHHIIFSGLLYKTVKLLCTVCHLPVMAIASVTYM